MIIAATTGERIVAFAAAITTIAGAVTAIATAIKTVRELMPEPKGDGNEVEEDEQVQ